MPPKQNKKQQPGQGTTGFPSMKRVALNSFTFPTIVRATINDSKTGAMTGNAFSFFLNYPTYYRDGNTGTIAQMQNVPTLLANEQKVFDEYKIHSCRLEYFPYIRGIDLLSSYTTASGNTGVTNISPVVDPSVITAIDLDDSALFVSYAKALNAQGAAFKSRFGTQPIFLAEFKQQDKVEAMKWLNLGAIIPNTSTPPDPNNPAKLASIKVWTNGYPLNSSAMGNFICTWKVWFKGVYTIS